MIVTEGSHGHSVRQGGHLDGFRLSWPRIPDPVGTGFVASLARPGGNITGLSNLRPELGGKRLEVLKETLPRLARVAILGTSSVPGTPQTLRETELAASAVGVQLQYLEVVGPKDIGTAFSAASRGRADAVFVLASPILLSHRAQMADLAAKSRLPAMYYTAEFVRDGGLMSYGVNATDLFRRAATYVDKILQGRQAGRSPRRATDEVRAGHQSEDRQGTRPDDPAVSADAGG